MTAGVSPNQIEQLIAEMGAMSPDELEAFLAEQQGDADQLSDGYLVDYCDQMIRTSYEVTKDRRERWDRLWEAHENEQMEYAEKEEWQSQMVLPKPFTTTIQAQSIVRRALMQPDAFTIESYDKEDPEKELLASFWRKGLTYWTNTRDARFNIHFSDAAGMGFATGISMGVKVLWRPDDNGVYRLVYQLIPPWNLFTDPERETRKPQSGLYLIHQEWKGLHELYDLADKGIYENVENVVAGRQSRDADGYAIEDREESRRRKGHLRHQNKYQKEVLVSELWGTLLDESGKILMPNVRYVVANGTVIRKPKPVTFPRMRWPIMQFSPIPHKLRFEGYGLWEGVVAMWKFKNNVLNLYADNENWRIQNMWELDPNKLEDVTDREAYPGKMWTRAKNAEEGPAIVPILKGDSNLQDVKFIWDLAAREWEEGSFVTEPLKGVQPQQDRTLGELQMKQGAAMGVFDLIAADTELGGEDIMWATQQVLMTFWDATDVPSLLKVFGRNSQELLLMEEMGLLMPQARTEQMALEADIRIRTISQLMEREDMVQRLNFLVTLGDNPRFTPFMKDYDICKAIFKEFGKQALIKTEEQVQQEMIQQAVHSAVDAAATVADQAMQPPPTGKPAGPGPKPAPGSGGPAPLRAIG